MSYGDEHAKKALLREAEELCTTAKEYSKRLNNGDAGDIKVQGKTIALIFEFQRLQYRMLEPLFMARLITLEDCKAKHEELEDKKTVSKIKVGPLEYQGNITTAMIVSLLSILPAGLLFFMYGKELNWW